MDCLSALFTPGHLGIQNMLQELLTLTRGQVVEEILRCHFDEPKKQSIKTESLPRNAFFVLWLLREFRMIKNKKKKRFICLFVDVLLISGEERLYL